MEKLALISSIAKSLFVELAFLLAFPFALRARGPRGVRGLRQECETYL